MAQAAVAAATLPIRYRHGSAGGEFVIEKNGERIAELSYVLSANNVASIDHTWVRPDFRARGIARKLVDAAVEWARASDVRLRPVCSYARLVLGRDKSAADVLA